MKNIKLLMAAAMLTVSLVSFTSINEKQQGEPAVQNLKKDKKGYEIGDAAADFKLKNVDGKMVSLSDFKTAKGFIVVFTCNHCPYAKAYEDRIIELDQKYSAMGYQVVAINPNDPEVQPEDGFKQMITRATEKNYRFPYLVDEGQKVFPMYGATKTPHVFILKKENKKKIVKYIGTIDDNYENASDVSERYVDEAVRALLSNQPVKKAKTVAIGCSIKVKK